MPILLNIYRSFGHGLKICMCFGYNPQIIFVTFLQVEFSHFSGVFTIKVSILCAELLLQFDVDSLETLQMFWLVE